MWRQSWAENGASQLWLPWGLVSIHREAINSNLNRLSSPDHWSCSRSAHSAHEGRWTTDLIHGVRRVHGSPSVAAVPCEEKRQDHAHAQRQFLREAEEKEAKAVQMAWFAEGLSFIGQSKPANEDGGRKATWSRDAAEGDSECEHGLTTRHASEANAPI